jgi:hypothetical protein
VFGFVNDLGLATAARERTILTERDEVATYSYLVSIGSWVEAGGPQSVGIDFIASAQAFSHHVALLQSWDGEPLQNDAMAMATMRAVMQTRQLHIRFGPDLEGKVIDRLNKRLADQGNFEIEISTRNLSSEPLSKRVLDPPSAPAGPPGPTLSASVQMVSMLRTSEGGYVFSFKLGEYRRRLVSRYGKVVEGRW